MTADGPGAHQKTIGADKNYDSKGFAAEIRRIAVTPHVAQNTSLLGGSAMGVRSTRHEANAKSFNARRGIEKVSAVFGLHVIAPNLIRLGNLHRPAMAAE
jgi:hypothetical protein